MVSLQQIFLHSKSDFGNILAVQEDLREEAGKMSQLLTFDSYLTTGTAVNNNTSERSDQSGTKGKRIGDLKSENLIALKRESEGGRSIAITLHSLIQDRDQESEEFRSNPRESCGDRESVELEELCRDCTQQEYTPKGADENLRELQKFVAYEKSLELAKRLSCLLVDNLDHSCKRTAIKNNLISDMRENIKDLNFQVQDGLEKIQDLEIENQKIRKKADQLEQQVFVSNEELNTLHARFLAVQRDYEIACQQNVDLKGGKENAQDFCWSLSTENERIMEQLLIVRKEKDNVYTDLQEKTKGLKLLLKENSDLQNKADVLGAVLTTLRKEYQEQSRELNSLSSENENLKIGIQEFQLDNDKLKRALKTAETGSKDLEDQMFQLTSANQKLRSEVSRLSSLSRQELETEVSELNTSVNKKKGGKLALAHELREHQITGKVSEIEIQFVHENNLTSNRNQDPAGNILLRGYEKLLIKLLNQQTEVLKICEFDKRPTSASSDLPHNFKKSTEKTNSEEIQSFLTANNDKVDETFDAINSHLHQASSERQAIYTFFQQISRHLSSCREIDKDSSHSAGRRNAGCHLLDARALCAQEETFTDENFIYLIMPRISQAVHDLQDCKQKLKELTTKLSASYKKEKNLRQKLSQKKRAESLLKRRLQNLSLHVVTKGRRDGRHVAENGDVMETADSKFITSISDLKVATEILNRSRNRICNILNAFQQPASGVSHQVVPQDDLTSDSSRVLARVDKDLSSALDKLDLLFNSCTCGRVESGQRISDMDKLAKDYENVRSQKKFMLSQIKFTNECLQVLLHHLKGEELALDGNTIALDLNCNITHPLSLVNKSLGRIASIQEISEPEIVPDLTEATMSKEDRDAYKESICAVESMRNHIEAALREAQKQIPNTVAFSDGLAGATSKNEHRGDVEPNSMHLSEMEERLEAAKKKVEDLSNYLEARELELTQRDETIARLQREYDELKKLSERDAQSDAAYERLVNEYETAKKRLENENAFLQRVVKELRLEMLSAQKVCRSEEDSKQHLEEFVKELELCKNSLEGSLEKMTYEMNLMKCDRDNLVLTLQSMSQNRCCNCLLFPVLMPQPYPGYPIHVAADSSKSQLCPYRSCQLCECTCLSDSSGLPFSDEGCDCGGSCDGFDSYPSDIGKVADDVISSSESQSTMSRIARITSTEEAALSIRSQSRSSKYQKKESFTGSHVGNANRDRAVRKSVTIIDPRVETPFDAPFRAPPEDAANSLLEPPLERVVGRREQRRRSLLLDQAPSSSSASAGTDISTSQPANEVSVPNLGHICKKKKKRPFLLFGRK